MIRKNIARASGFAVGAAMVIGFATQAGAATSAELQAQIAALMAQLQAMQGGVSTSVTFTRDLTIGSTGADVSALQQWLVSKGFLTMPVGVAYGYFGGLTQAAVGRWQASAGIFPTAGYFGPKSRAAVNTTTVTTTTTTTTSGVAGCAPGAMFSATTGLACGTTTTTTTTTVNETINTPGVEGTLTVTSAPVSSSTLYEGDMKQSVLAFKAEANTSDIAIQRVKVDLGTDSDFYRDVLSRIYVVDDNGKTIASSDLNTNTVVKEADDSFSITLTGFSSVVAKDTTRTYTIKVDVRSSVDSADLIAYTIRLAANGVRGIDGAGIDQYSPAAATTVSRSTTFSASLIDSATLAVSTGSNTPTTQEIIASGGSAENESDKVVLLNFDIRAEKDAVTITDLKNFVVTSSGGTAATASSTFLYAGNGTSGQLLGTASAVLSDVDFTDISYTIPANTTRSFTLATDIRSANTVQTTFTTTFTGNTTNVVAENSSGDTVATVSGSATGNSILVRNIGPVFTLSGTPTIVKSATASQNNTSTSTITATFNVRIRAVGGPIYFGLQTASTTFGIATYFNSVRNITAAQQGASTTSFTTPSSGVVTTGLKSTTAFQLQENNEIIVPVTFISEGRTAAGALVTTGNYAAALEYINWTTDDLTNQRSTFMAGLTEWRTAAVALP